MLEHLTIGKKVRQIRRFKDITQNQLASLTGCHPNTIYKIEAGDRSVKPKTLLLVLDILRCNIPEFFSEFNVQEEYIQQIINLYEENMKYILDEK